MPALTGHCCQKTRSKSSVIIAVLCPAFLCSPNGERGRFSTFPCLVHNLWILVPLKELLTVLREKVHEADLAQGGPDDDLSVPYLEEFLEFVCSDKEALKSEGRPYED